MDLKHGKGFVSFVVRMPKPWYEEAHPAWRGFVAFSRYWCSPGDGMGHLVEGYWNIYKAGYGEGRRQNDQLRRFHERSGEGIRETDKVNPDTGAGEGDPQVSQCPEPSSG